MHKFTMHDLPNKNGYREKATEIEIQQSHSYEITEQTNYQPTGSQSYQHEQVYEDPVPVIVLRIPGPQKYALHLQALLQQYLEIRAAQYIKALEDQERRGHLQHPQQYVPHHHLQHQQQQMQYMSMYVTPMHHQGYYQTQPQPHPGFQQYYQVHHGNNYASVPAGEQSYYTHQTQQAQEYHHQPSPQQQEYPSSYINFVTPSYDQVEQSHQQVHQSHHQDQSHEVETNENYPSEKHTQVIFKKKKNRVHRPSITYHHQSEPIVVADTQQQHEAYPNHQEHHQQVQQLYAYTNNFNEQSEESEHVVAVTQRTQSPPVNYHVLKSTLAPTQEEIHERHNPKRMASAPFTKEQFEKARKMMTKSKRNRGSVRQQKQIEKATEAPKS
jgi:hypothetical protein